jgi:LysM repeat protein
MQALRQLGAGLLLGLLSVIIVFGGMSLALAEGYVPQPLPSPTETQTALPSAPTEAVSSTPSPLPTGTATTSPIPPTNCPPPAGWILVSILPGDTLDSMAFRYHATPAALMAANCLVSPYILPGYGLYVPAPPTATYIPCGAPYGWVRYTVQPGDNLYRISLLYRITITELKQANCLTSDVISVGQLLWVPNTVTSTPPATPINIEFPTVTPVDTETVAPTSTLEPPATSTEVPPSPTIAPTETPPPPTNTPAPTETTPPTTP